MFSDIHNHIRSAVQRSCLRRTKVIYFDVFINQHEDKEGGRGEREAQYNLLTGNGEAAKAPFVLQLLGLADGCFW